MNYSISDIIRIKKERFSGKMLNAFFATIVFLVISFAISFATSMIVKDNEGALYAIVTLLSGLLQVYIGIVLSAYFLKSAFKDGKYFSSILPRFRPFIRYLGVEILIGLVSFVALLVVLIATTFSLSSSIMQISAGEVPELSSLIVPFILLVVAFVIIMYISLVFLLSVYSILLNKDDLGVIDSMKLSARIMKGKKIKFLLLEIFYSLIFIVGIIVMVSMVINTAYNIEPSSMYLGVGVFDIFKSSIPGAVLSLIGFFVATVNINAVSASIFAEAVESGKFSDDFRLNTNDDLDVDKIVEEIEG